MPPKKRKNQGPNIVPNKERDNQGSNKCPFVTHRFAKPCRNKLQVVECVGCGEQGGLKNILTYNQRRRTYRIVKNLYSLVAPVTANSSIHLLENVARQFQIFSNVLGHHLSLVEGLALSDGINEQRNLPTEKSRSREELIVEPIRNAMSLNNNVRIRRINLLPTYRGHLMKLKQKREFRKRRRLRIKGSSRYNHHDNLDELLVVLETEFAGPELARAVRDLHKNAEYCLLPQYPLHVSLGTITLTPSMIPDLREELHRDLVGKALALNWSRLTLLGPPRPENDYKPRKRKQPEKSNNIPAAASLAYNDMEEEEDEGDDDEEHREVSAKRFKSDRVEN